MERINSKTVKYSIVIALLLAVSYYSRYFHVYFSDPVVRMLLVMTRSIIQISLVIYWCMSIRRRIISSHVRRLLLATGVLLAFWLVLRTCKWEFISSGGTDLGRYCWYGYYIPIIFVPLMGVFIIDYIGKPEEYEASGRLKYLYIPALLLVGTVFTNDFHQMVFSFPMGLEAGESDYQYRPLYFAVMAWCIFLSFYFVVMLLKKSRTSVSRSLQRIPLIILAGAVVFWTLYCLNIAHGDLAAVNCIIIILLLESAIQSGLIPSNSMYNELFRNSSISAQIVDNEYRPCISSASASALDTDIIRRAVKGPVDYGDTILHGKRIKGGYVLWQEDVSTVNKLIKSYREMQEVLGESNEIISSEIELKEKRIRTEEKSRLYEQISREVAPQLESVDKFLNLAEDDLRNAKSIIARLSVFYAYIKRKGNLMLLEEERKCASSKELEYCIRESAESIRLAGITTSVESICEGNTSVEMMVSAFDFYQRIIEEFIDDATAILISLDCRNSFIRMCIQVGCRHRLSESSLSSIRADYGNIEYEIQDEDVIISLMVDGGDIRC